MSSLFEHLRDGGFTRKPADWPASLAIPSDADVRKTLAENPAYSPRRLDILMSDAADRHLEALARTAQQLTRQRFGKTVKLFAPLYVSNFCVNRCRYCGFNATHAGERRRRLSLDEAVREAETIAAAGFRDLLLVSGEDPSAVSVDYLVELARRLRGTPSEPGLFSALSVEIHRLDGESYARLLDAGVDGMTMFQETYDLDRYPHWHPAGPKADGPARLTATELAARAGMRRLGLGALLGLEDWRFEARALAAHADWLMRNHWRTQVSFSLPRIRPAEAMAEAFPHRVDDRSLLKLILALRLCFPDAGLTLSTRESAALRDRLIPLGITQVSAGSRTDPGGYAHGGATEQFEIADPRSAAEMADWLVAHGFDPVWKDWDAGFATADPA